MDRRGTRPARPSHRLPLADDLAPLEARRLLAAGAAQVSIQETTTNGVTVLTITGTNRADRINVKDNGTGDAGNLSITLADGSSYTSKSAIATVQIKGRGGNDQVSYTLTGELVAARAVFTDLGTGNDQFVADVNANVNNLVGLDLETLGGAGNDRITVNQPGNVIQGSAFPYLEGGSGNDILTFNGTGSINSAASLGPGLSGDSGNDTITATYTGVVRGTLEKNLTIDGGSGNDSIRHEIHVAKESSGFVGMNAASPATVDGGSGNDTIYYKISVDPSGAPTVNALVLGGTGADTVQHSGNVSSESSSEKVKAI